MMMVKGEITGENPWQKQAQAFILWTQQSPPFGHYRELMRLVEA